MIATAAHPGLVATDIYAESTGVTRWMVRFAQSPEMGALDVLYAAVGKLPGNTFIGPKNMMHMRGVPEVIKASKTSQDPEIGKRLWTASEQMTGVHFGLPA